MPAEGPARALPPPSPTPLAGPPSTSHNLYQHRPINPPHSSGPVSAPAAGNKETVHPLRSIRHNAFKPGEKLTYLVHYGWLNAGEAVVELKEVPRTVQGRKVWQAVGTGRSLGAFNAFYKVDDHYSSVFDAEGVFPWVFSRSVSEGGYEFKQDYVYHQHKRQVTTQRQQTHEVPASVQDMLSAFYYARTIDFSRAKPGDIYTIDCFLDDELWPLRMKYIGKETIKLRNVTYRWLRFQPVVQEGRIFKGEAEITRLSPSARAKLGIGRAFQLTNLFPKLSVLENVRLAVQARAGQGGRILSRASALTEIRDKAHAFVEATRLSPVAALPAAALPHGDQRKLEVAMLAAMEPDVFMFDEPTAGMSADEAPAILELIAEIKKDTAKTIMLVEHKMDVVRALADRIVVLHNGALIADGKPAEVMALPLVRDIYLGLGTEEVA